MSSSFRLAFANPQTQDITKAAPMPGLMGNVATQYEPDVKRYLSEYRRLEKAGFASEGMRLTLHRCYPNETAFKKYKDLNPLILNGRASVAVIDNEGQLITLPALKKGLDDFLGKEPQFRNLMWLHSNQQIGVCLPVYKTADGKLLKSKTNESERALYIIGDVDRKHSLFPGLQKSILNGTIKDYSIGGRIKDNKIVRKFTSDMRPYVEIGSVEFSEITVCPKGVNPESPFQVVKAALDPQDRLSGSDLLQLMRNLSQNR